MNLNRWLFLFAASTLIAGCGNRNEQASSGSAPDTMPTPAAVPAAPPPPAAEASAELAPTQGNTASGTFELIAEGNALRITGKLTNLPPNGEFGFHIHEKGDCSAPDASSAGGHFNPANTQHGNPLGESHHAGDMLNAKSDMQGEAIVDAVASGVSLESGQPNDVRGKAIVLHEKADDYASQPAGNSGARIACGVIN